MITRRNLKQSICSIVAAGFCAGCASTNPPPLPPGNAADPQISGRTRTPPNVLARDETTLAIANELGQTENTAKSSEGMQHEGMQHDGMQGMQPEGVKMEEHAEAKHGGAMESHEGMRHGAAAQPEKKAVADEMKKTSDEMKATFARFGVPEYWLLDPHIERMERHSLTASPYQLTLSAGPSDTFESIVLSGFACEVAGLFPW